MNNAKINEAIDMIINGLEALKDVLAVSSDSGSDEKAAPKKAVAKKEVTKPVAKKAAPVEEEDSNDNEQTFTRAELKGMKYNDFKKTAASLGVDCKGTRDDIMKRIEKLGVIVDGEAEADEEPVEEEKPSKPVAKKPVAKKEEKEAGDEFDEQAEAIMEDTPVEDVISALKDVGVKATKLNCKSKLAQALRDGLLDLDDDEDSEDEDDSADEEFDADSYFEEYDLSGANNPKNMTDERADAIPAKVAEILVCVENGELSSDDIIDYLQNNASQEELDLLGDEYTEEDVLKLYIEVAKHFIDNDGEEHEPGEAYEIGDDNFCCGHPLKYDKKKKQYICEHCTTVYEA